MKDIHVSLPSKPCIHKDCHITASYGLKGDKANYCKTHKPSDEYILVRITSCIKCSKMASYALPGDKPKTCLTHIQKGYINVKSKKCKKCFVRATYGLYGCTAEYCNTHKPSDKYINVRIKKCNFKGCNSEKTYGLKGCKVEYCSIHKPSDEYIDLKNNKCIYPECDIIPNYGIKGSFKANYCVKHAPKDYENITSPKCKYSGCDITPSYGKTKGKREYCVTHAPKGYISCTKLCLYPDCTTTPSFGLKETRIKEYCNTHKPSDKYINLIKKNCLYPDCPTTASFGLKETRIKEYCNTHKPSDNYINLTKKICSSEECENYATYGYPGKQPEFCGSHKKIGVKVNPRRLCIICKKHTALYGYTYATHCEDHKIDDQLDLVQKECKSCNLPEILNKDNICSVCNPQTFIRARLAKQKTVRNYFDYIKLKYISYDKQIERGECGKERPDFLFDCNTHFIVVEIDEEQHNGRDCSCEQIRMINIANSLGMNTIFIRWNPDKYKTIKGFRQMTAKKRLDSLKDIIVKLKQKIPDNFVSCTYMFFDEDRPEKWLDLIKLC